MPRKGRLSKADRVRESGEAFRGARRSDGPGQGPVKPESAGSGPVTGKTRGFLADTIYIRHY